MPQQETWVVDGYNLSQFAHDIQTFDGLDVTPEIKGADIDVPQRHGLLPATNYFAEAHKAVSMIISTADPATGVVPQDIHAQRVNFDKNLDSLLRIMYRRKLLTVTRTLSDGSQRQALCKVVAGIQPSTLGLASAQITFDLMLPYSFWRDVNPATVGIAMAADGTQLNFAAFNTATAPMWDLLYEIVGPVTNPKLTCLETGAWVQYTGAIAAGQSLKLDAGAMSIAGTGGLAPTAANVTHAGDPRWLTLIPNADGCIVQVNGAGFTGASTLNVTGKKAFLR